MATRAAYYARFSSEEQLASNSIELQTQSCLAAIRQNGWDLAAEHAFLDRASSGTTQTGREGLQRLRDSAHAHAFDVVVVYKYDRLGRNFLQTVHLIQELDRLGIRVLSATEGDDPLTRNILLSVADNYSRQLSAFSRDGMRQTALAGYSTGGRPPYGYQRHEVVDPHKRDRQGQPVRKALWNPDERHAPIVRRIFSLYLEGCGFKRIAVALNADGIPGPRGDSWATSAVREILHNPTYAGFRAFGRNRKIRLATGKRSKQPRPASEWTLVPDAHPAIIPAERWKQVQTALDAAARKAHPSLGATRSARSRYPLVGLVKCGVCHGNFSVDRRHNGAGRIYEDYVCGRRKDRGKSVCDNTVRVSRAQLDRRILALVTHRLVDPAIRETLRARIAALRAHTADAARASRPALQKELIRVEGKIKTYLERLALLPPEAARMVGEQLEQLGTEKQQLQARLQVAEHVDRAASAFLVALGAGPRLLVPSVDPARRSRILGLATARVLEDLEDSAPETVRTRLKSLVRQVTVTADGKVTVEGTYEPLVMEELTGADRRENGGAEIVRRMLVPGDRTHN
jgi:site-specific DNA recombinase